MNAPEKLFNGDLTQIGNVDFEAPLAEAKSPCCDYYVTQYGKAAEQAKEKGDVNAAAIYHFLGAITSFYPRFDTPDQPFSPMIQMEGKRSPIPSDLLPDDILALRQLTKFVKDAALRSRLFDVLWELTKDHTACAEASASYVLAAEKLNTIDGWVHTTAHYHRGLYLAAKLGRTKDLFKRASESLQQAVRTAANDSEQFRCCQLMEILIRFGCGDPAEFAPIAADRAKKASDESDHRCSRHYWEVAADFYKFSKNPTGEKAARLAAAETHVSEYEQRIQGAGASAMAAAWFLQNGIEALRQAGASRERIDELRSRLTKLQADSLKEMKTVSTKIDISKPVEAAREHVQSPDFTEALFKFAFGQKLSKPKEIRESVLKLAKDFPMSHLFTTCVMDDKGRTTVKKEGLLNLKGEEFEQALEAEMFSHEAQMHWSIRVSGYIEPARLQIFNDHHPTFRDLVFVVRNNPFIPPGHEGIFLRGLHSGFHGDFLVASHLLVPQIENSLRHVLESHGVDVSNLMSDGTQPVKVLGAIFNMKETEKIFGESLCFELRGCLIQKTGFDFRNRVAHGFVSEAECYSVAAETIWWLALRICLTPVAQAIAEQKQNQSPSVSSTR